MQIVPPKRAAHTYVQTLVTPPDQVFTLLCPVREADWIDGRDPRLMISASGVVEPDCVFVTPSEGTEATWVVTRHEPAAGFVEMLKITPGVTACRLTIRLRAAPKVCSAEITYRHTSLGPSGDTFVDGFTEVYYKQFMQDWEARLNHYLNYGQALRTTDG